MPERFGAVGPDGVGYMYGNERVPAKPVHRIVQAVRSGKMDEGKLIPPGDRWGREFWLPKELW